VKELEPFVWLIVFIVSVTTHEAAHAWVAYLGGDRTAYLGGQVSLNPIPHMRREPFGMVVLPLIGVLVNGFPIGWASTPFDPAWEQRHPRRAAWMAAAGPAANLALAGLALLVIKGGLAAGFFEVPLRVTAARMVLGHVDWVDGLGRFLSMMLTLNTILCLFNLIPFPPLDGASALTLLMPADLGLRFRQALRRPGIGIIGLFAVWYGFGYVVQPVMRAVFQLVAG
jgi:Zn-dependent protease